MQKEDLINYWINSGIIKDFNVIKAFRKIPRENFILKDYKKRAYEDIALPIKAGQTISQPSTVVFMLDKLELKKGNKVLEIGTGSGYNAALMSILVGRKGKVYTTEIIKELVSFAKKNIEKLKLKNVRLLHLDGSKGYDKEKPYDRIIVTAACPEIPNALIEQLKEGGILIAPVGGKESQNMIKCIKIKGRILYENLGGFRFVPLKGRQGWK